MSIHHIGSTDKLLVAGPARVMVNGNADVVPVVGSIAAPVISTLAPNTAVHAAVPDVNMTVNGTGFNEFSKIVFNGHDEPTTLLSATQVRTIVKPSVFLVPAVCPVQVRNGEKVSNSLNFTFT